MKGWVGILYHFFETEELLIGQGYAALLPAGECQEALYMMRDLPSSCTMDFAHEVQPSSWSSSPLSVEQLGSEMSVDLTR